MKRARHTSDNSQDEEPPTKHLHTDNDFQLTPLGPFTLDPTWNDFWIELLRFIASIDLWRLSCISKPFHSLAWSLLIPNFTPTVGYSGLYLTPATSFPDIGNYFSRAGGLNELDLWEFSPLKNYDVMQLLTRLTKLVDLRVPVVEEVYNIEFPLEYISHLTNSLTSVSNVVAPSPKLLSHFVFLRRLQIFYSGDPRFIVHLNQLTNLEELRLDSSHPSLLSMKDEDGFSGSIQHLTKLVDLRIFGTREALVDGQQISHEIRLGKSFPKKNSCFLGCQKQTFADHFSSGDLTNLKRLYLDGIQDSRQITKFTNLQEIGINFAPDFCLRDIIQHLTKLKALRFFQDEGITCPQASHNITSLSNLTKLWLQADQLKPETGLCPRLAALPNLTTLKLIEPSPASLVSALHHLTRLSTLCICASSESFGFDAITQLIRLDLNFPPDANFSYPLNLLKPLTQLKTLKLRWPEDWRRFHVNLTPDALPTSLNFLVLREAEETDEFLELCCGPLTSLKKLKLNETDLTPQGINFIAKNLIQIEGLNLEDSCLFVEEITEENIHYLNPLFSLTRLESLKLGSQSVKRFWIDYWEHQKREMKKLV